MGWKWLTLCRIYNDVCYLVNKYPPKAAPKGDLEVAEAIEGEVPDMFQRVQAASIFSN